MVDALYIRGWEDCLEALSNITKQTKNYEDVKRKIERLRDLVHEQKFERMRMELGVYDVF
ncbi:MAG: hypothetical protein N3D85_07805 [Candidatus Bathyarchaeota archaeon]|nr:hypothetical protein [Candidatus Bathyarchaeota archaeon]